MISPTTPTERLLFTTVRIETTTKSGAVGSGTGFFYEHKLEGDKRLTLIVTNKHVVAGAVKGRFQLHEANSEGEISAPAGKFFTIELDGFEQQWFAHPDASVDLCVMAFQPLRNLAEKHGQRIFNVSFDEALIPVGQALDDLNAVEDILMAGYPNGLWDSTNNLPLIRKGITASHPAIGFCGRQEFVIDAACFPGSSGSPVLLVNTGSFSDKKGNVIIGGRIVLLGILYAGPQMNAEGKIVPKPIPTTFVPISETRVMIHLGYVVRAAEIITAAKQFESALRSKGLL